MTGLLAGKAALVTGGGSGIGRATALAFAREGARVAVADLALETAQETVMLINAAGGQAIAVAADVTDDAAVAAMVRTTVSAFGALDCAFNNAGIAPRVVGAGGQKIADVAPEAWDRMIDVNLTGVWRCLRHEVAQMRQQATGGAIVNTASIGGLVALPMSSAYTVGKHGVVGLSKLAAKDHADEKIRVNAVCPGYIETPMTTQSLAEHGERIRGRTAMGREGQPGEIAELVVFLCSDRASYITGAAYAADGGYTAV